MPHHFNCCVPQCTNNFRNKPNLEYYRIPKCDSQIAVKTPDVVHFEFLDLSLFLRPHPKQVLTVAHGDSCKQMHIGANKYMWM